MFHMHTTWGRLSDVMTNMRLLWTVTVLITMHVRTCGAAVAVPPPRSQNTDLHEDETRHATDVDVKPLNHFTKYWPGMDIWTYSTFLTYVLAVIFCSWHSRCAHETCTCAMSPLFDRNSNYSLSLYSRKSESNWIKKHAWT